MLCNELETVLEQHGLNPLPADACEHLAACPACQDLLADFSAIAVAAKRLPAEVDPPERIWVSLRAQLEAEGIIRDPQPVAVPVAMPWRNGIAQSFRLRTWASVGAGLFLVLGSIYLVEHRGAVNTAKNPQPAPTQISQTPKTFAPPSVQASPVLAPKNLPRQTQSARVTPPSQPRPSTTVLKPSPSESAYLGDSAAVLTQTEDALPSRELANNALVDASLRQNLRTLNEFIAECEARLKHNPQDQLTREYLNMAYQQKAELLAAMMDTGRSEH